MLDLSTHSHDDSLDMSIKVVLVEDDEKISQLLSSYLTMQQIETVCVHDGADAVATILAEQPDLVILDLMLPNLDGFSICRQLQPVFDGKILFLTASEETWIRWRHWRWAPTISSSNRYSPGSYWHVSAC